MICRPFREPPLDPSLERAIVTYERWKLHPFRIVKDGNVPACPWCLVASHRYNRGARCFGVRRAWFFARLCPPIPHHHMDCRTCGSEWLELTCDEAPDPLRVNPTHRSTVPNGFTP